MPFTETLQYKGSMWPHIERESVRRPDGRTEEEEGTLEFFFLELECVAAVIVRGFICGFSRFEKGKSIFFSNLPWW